MTQPASGAPRSELDGSGSVTRLMLLRFTAAGVVVMVLLTIGIAIAAIQPSLVPGVAAGQALAVAALDTAVRRFVLGGSLVRIKIWDEDGKILYSDAATLIGKRSVLDMDKRRMADQGHSVAGASDLEDSENALEADFGKLLEVYLGLRMTTGQPVLFEGYFRYDDVVSASWDTWLRFAPPPSGRCWCSNSCSCRSRSP
jgi:two-component system, NarL family, sensor kinase